MQFTETQATPLSFCKYKYYLNMDEKRKLKNILSWNYTDFVIVYIDNYSTKFFKQYSQFYHIKG